MQQMGNDMLNETSNKPSALLNAFLGFGLVAIVVYVCVVGRHILVPLAVALFLWFLINALSNVLQRWHMPRGAAVAVSCVVLIGAFVGVLELMAYNIANMVKSIPTTGTDLQETLQSLATRFGIEKLPSVSDFGAVADFGASAVAQIASGLEATAGVVVTVILYIVFLLAEQHGFGPKLRAYFGNKEKSNHANRTMAQIATKIQAYLWNKTLVSVLVGVVSYIVMKLVGLEYAEFWAIVIFLFNYIPFIGAMIATVLPAAFALIQFPTVTQPVIMVVGLITGHFIIGNVLEPRIQGKSLNLSPLVILLSMSFWGSLWGVVGMLLCVPITAGIMVVCAQSASTRRFAVLLSESGDIDDLIVSCDESHSLPGGDVAHA